MIRSRISQRAILPTEGCDGYTAIGPAKEIRGLAESIRASLPEFNFFPELGLRLIHPDASMSDMKSSFDGFFQTGPSLLVFRRGTITDESIRFRRIMR